MAGALLSSICSLAEKLLPAIQSSASAPSSSSIPQIHVVSVGDDLRLLTATLARIQATLLEAEEREIRDHLVKHWLGELKQVAYAAEDLLDEYQYDARKAQIMSNYNLAKRKRILVRNLSLLYRIPHDMGDKIREIRIRFDEIAKDREALRLREEDGERRQDRDRSPPPTCPLVDESSLFGREKEREEVINLLITECNKNKRFSVLPIVGKGGLGKTTLAQLVYNDWRIHDRFDQLVWVYVSDSFDVERLTKAIIEGITGESCSLTDVSTMQIKLAKIVKGERIFVVLDDVWNEDRRYWQALSAPLIKAEMVTILVTIRNEQVARIMQTIPFFHLGYLPHDKSWLLFQHIAFGCSNYDNNLNLVEIGSEIVRKCDGLPLAVKSIASLLKCEWDEDFWREILESAVWVSNDGNEVFSALQISYAHLPGYLKACFLFCSMFPQHHCFEKDLMIRLWIAHGYVSEGKRSLHEIGDGYITELMQRSFFDKCDFSKERNTSMFKIHDMVHDFARYISGNEDFVMEAEKLPDNTNEIFHLYVKGYVGLVRSFFLGSFTDLRTLVLDASFEETTNDHIAKNALEISQSASTLELQEGGVRVLLSVENVEQLCCILSEDILHEQKQNVLALAKNLRALVLRGGSRIELLDSIGNLKHLRLLALDSYNFAQLPEQISRLYNLEMFTVCNSPLLVQLPVCLGHLISLRYLSLSYTGIRKLPESMFLLDNLRTLILDGSQIETLPESICYLDSLNTLSLIYCKMLKYLPEGIGYLVNLQFMDLDYSGVVFLPESVHRLTSLERLSASLWVRTSNKSSGIGVLRDLNNLRGSLSIYGLANATNLEDFEFSSLRNKRNIRSLLLSWFESGTIVPKDIEELSLKLVTGERNSLVGMDLKVLESLQPHPSLKRFEMHGYRASMFPTWMGDPLSCASLESICIHSCQFQNPLPFCNLPSLRSLSIIQCNNIQTLISQESLPVHLHFLYLMYCEQILCLAGLNYLENLVRLYIHGCPNVQLPLDNPLPSTLEMLHIDGCRRLRSFAGLRKLTKLDDLTIARCPMLQFTRDEHISSVPSNIEITACPGLAEWCQEQSINYEPEA
ncbi:Disease resistance protein (CC-NBS-LRR class) family [Rhynchospora pubera]|uniref:Disease resistance protein (CC-NBS-LRR class) family n=1 Tax=Rhynchospora pubera TaxID=906938 RepID=A0AAV8F0E1_9POAL|nr:Disease resistance protein (CC-NBS-LRR class) family [Rhynchospora pubera]